MTPKTNQDSNKNTQAPNKNTRAPRFQIQPTTPKLQPLAMLNLGGKADDSDQDDDQNQERAEELYKKLEGELQTFLGLCAGAGLTMQIREEIGANPAEHKGWVEIAHSLPKMCVTIDFFLTVFLMLGSRVQAINFNTEALQIKKTMAMTLAIAIGIQFISAMDLPSAGPTFLAAVGMGLLLHLVPKIIAGFK